MKTFIKICLIFVGIILIAYILLGSWGLYTYEFLPTPPVVDKKSLPDYFVVKTLDGNSISQYGFSDGQDMRVFYNLPCRVGDICNFKCLAEKCWHSDTVRFFKKVQSIDSSGCYFFIGNSDPWLIGDIRYVSWDSRVYGSLCPGEVRIYGRVVN